MFNKGDVVVVKRVEEMLDNKFVKGDIFLEMMLMMAGEMLGDKEVILTVKDVEVFADSGISFLKFEEDPDLELPDFCVKHAEPKPVKSHDCQCRPKVPFDVAADLDDITASGIHDNLFGHVHTVLSDYLDNSDKPAFPHVHSWLKADVGNRKLFLKAIGMGYVVEEKPALKPVSFIEALAHMKDGKVAVHKGIEYVAKDKEFIQYRNGRPTRLDFDMTLGEWFLK